MLVQVHVKLQCGLQPLQLVEAAGVSAGVEVVHHLPHLQQPETGNSAPPDQLTDCSLSRLVHRPFHALEGGRSSGSSHAAQLSCPHTAGP